MSERGLQKHGLTACSPLFIYRAAWRIKSPRRPGGAEAKKKKLRADGDGGGGGEESARWGAAGSVVDGGAKKKPAGQLVLPVHGLSSVWEP